MLVYSSVNLISPPNPEGKLTLLSAIFSLEILSIKIFLNEAYFLHLNLKNPYPLILNGWRQD